MNNKRFGEYFALLNAAGELVQNEDGNPVLITRPGPHFEDNARRSDRRVILVEVSQVKRIMDAP